MLNTTGSVSRIILGILQQPPPPRVEPLPFRIPSEIQTDLSPEANKGFQYGLHSGKNASCDPPTGITKPSEWIQGCQLAMEQKGNQHSGPPPVPFQTQKDWTYHDPL